MKSKISKELLEEEAPARKLTRDDYLSCGHTLGNLAISGEWYGAFVKGYYFWLWGDSDSGKSIIGYNAMAEACNNPSFDDYNIVLDSTEEADLIELEEMFGSNLVERMQPANGTKEEPVYSRISEEFYCNLDNWLSRGPCLYLLDSETALDSRAARAKNKKNRKAIMEGKAPKKGEGSMGDGKATVNSQNIRRMIPIIKETRSILLVVSQARFGIGPMAKFINQGKTVAGGEALKYYATAQIFTTRRKSIKIERESGPTMAIGTLANIHVKRSRLTGKERSIPMSIYPGVGPDDVGDCVDFLIREKHWRDTKGVIKAAELDFTGDRDMLIKMIEETDSEDQLRKIVARVWNAIESEVGVVRKKRYE